MLSHLHVFVMQKTLERYLLPDARQMVHELTEATGPGFRKLNDAVSPVPDVFRNFDLRLLQSILHQHGWSELFHVVLNVG